MRRRQQLGPQQAPWWEAEGALAAMRANTARLVKRRGEIDGLMWRLRVTKPPKGPYVVTMTSVKKKNPNKGWLLQLLKNLAQNPALDLTDEQVFFDRVTHIGPQTLATGVSEKYAVEIKERLEGAGARVKITEAVGLEASDSRRRKPIPERVRNEVWRRDGGRCVDCGSRERLEFDHIIPFSKGGSNTARNLELRCESCNRKKAARI